jgi:hypothetical protein
MKNKFILLGLLLAFIGCTDLSELNIDKKNPVLVPGETLFTSAQKNLVDQMVSTNVNYNVFRLFAQYWTEATYVDEANYDLITRAISQQHWDELYRRTLANLKEAARLISNTEVPDPLLPEKNNKLAIIEVLSVYTWSVLVETFGNIPYTQALDPEILNPVYDDGLTIYKDLISRLNAAIAKMDVSAGSFDAGADNIYQGDVLGWMYFANSLKLRMGLTISDIASESALARTTIESAAAAGVIDDNADNATMEYQESTPNTNPLYIDLVASGRLDFIGANTFVDVLNALNDPRRKYYFQNNINEDTDPSVSGYVGAPYGIPTGFSQASNVSKGEFPGDFALLDPTFPGTLFSYAEVEFLLAEAAAKGYNVGGTVEEHYNKGITASILEWGGTQEEADAYLAQPSVAYATAAGTWQQKVGTQEWIALYNRGFEAWSAYRRLDFPILVAPVDADSPIVPVRMTYPIVEQTLNPDNYDAAAAAIGGDEMTTKLFFDIF